MLETAGGIGHAAGMTHYHIDTDMGVDDGLALLLASRLLGADVTLSTVFGNVPVDVATRNALIFRALLGRSADWQVLRGASRALDGFTRDARHVHGADGMGGATAQLPQAIIDAASAAQARDLAGAAPPGSSPVVLIGLGPATNIPFLVSWYGRAAIQRIVLMSGALFDLGNITPAAEFNAHCDPDALREVLGLGIPTTMVPLDVCRKVQLGGATLADYANRSGTARGRLIAKSHEKYMAFYREAEGIDGCNPHDAIAVLVALSPAWFFAVNGTVSVDSAPDMRGHTSLTLGASHVDVVMGGRLKWVRETIAETLNADALC